jgi:hypothetical protein
MNVKKNLKSMRMRKVIIGLLLIGQISCSNKDFDINSFMDDSFITSLNGTWRVISFENFSANTVEYKNQENSWDLDIIVTFNDNIYPNLFYGKVTTNSVGGEFEYVGQRQFRLNRYWTTYVGQPVWADKFRIALLDSNVSFRVNRDRLRIYFENKTKSVTLTRD